NHMDVYSLIERRSLSTALRAVQAGDLPPLPPPVRQGDDYEAWVAIILDEDTPLSTRLIAYRVLRAAARKGHRGARTALRPVERVSYDELLERWRAGER